MSAHRPDGALLFMAGLAGGGFVLALAALIASRWLAPGADEPPRIEAALLAAAPSPDVALDLSPFAPRVCFIARVSELAAQAGRLGARRPQPPAGDPGRPVILLLPARGEPQALAMDRRRIDWDPAEGGGAFCARAVKVSPTTSGGVYLAEFIDMSDAAVGEGPVD